MRWWVAVAGVLAALGCRGPAAEPGAFRKLPARSPKIAADATTLWYNQPAAEFYRGRFVRTFFA